MKRQEFWKMFNEDFTNLFTNLYFRWEDEKEYEDIKDYLEHLQKNVKYEGVEIYSITKRPFGIKCKCADGNIHVKIKDEGDFVRIIAKSIA